MGSVHHPQADEKRSQHSKNATADAIAASPGSMRSRWESRGNWKDRKKGGFKDSLLRYQLFPSRAQKGVSPASCAFEHKGAPIYKSKSNRAKRQKSQRSSPSLSESDPSRKTILPESSPLTGRDSARWKFEGGRKNPIGEGRDNRRKSQMISGGWSLQPGHEPRPNPNPIPQSRDRGKKGNSDGDRESSLEPATGGRRK